MDSGASSGSSSSQICAICLASMKAGEAIFKSECAHSFHFQCIASSVNHGNRICPTCRANWQQVPLQAYLHPLNNPLPQQQNFFRPTPYPNLPLQQQQNPFGLFQPLPQQQNPFGLFQPLPQQQNPFALFPTPNLPVNEPSVFNDDEALDLQTSNNNNNNTNTSARSSLQRVLMKTYTEVPAVPRFSTVEDFTILINLKAPVLASERASVDLVTVLDISGSMTGRKLFLLKRAMGFVIQNLGPGDRLSVVVFSNTARRLFPLKKMSDTGKQHALQAVNSLVANGGTNIAQGLITGAKVMNDRREINPVASMILLSDGQDTFGLRGGWDSSSGGDQYWSNQRLLVLQGIDVTVHAFGFGTDHDALLMHSISEMTGGTFSFIETESVIQDAFAQCIGGLLSVVVKGLQVIVESAIPGIEIRSLKTGSYTSHLTADRKSGRIEVGDLYADEERDFLVSVNIPKEAKLTFRDETLLLKVHCSYTDPMTNEAVNLASENVTIERPESVGNENVVSIEVDRQRNRLQSAEAMAQARTAAEAGDMTRAVSILENFRNVLAGTESARSRDSLCMALDAELKEMQERMGSRQVYENFGRAYTLAGLSSHTSQRATAREATFGGRSAYGGSGLGGGAAPLGAASQSFGAAFGGGMVQVYQTPSMTAMLNRSAGSSK